MSGIVYNGQPPFVGFYVVKGKAEDMTFEKVENATSSKDSESQADCEAG
jgi:hypothetical protein